MTETPKLRLLPLLTALLLCGSRDAPGGEPLRFNRDIRPILSEHCFPCHGPDARQRQAGLRLDVEASARGELASGMRAIVGGRPDESELISRVTSAEPSERMPPPSTGKALTPTQIDLLKRWIALGAGWEGHWSLQPIGRPVPPPISAADGAPEFLRNPIDAFVLAGMRANGLSPAAPADRVTLLRRVSFDLVGLPPSSAEVSAFLADEAPDAYERVVDRMLASPHLGERMAIFWLDLVRYADSGGYFADRPVPMSPYRDWVIDAFNSNLPFDRFTVEQLAGDLRPERTERQQIASAYNRLGRMSTESGVQEREYLAKYAGERVRNLGTTWLGLTLGCCECHDHKFDPLTSRDFYRLAAYFADIKERGVYEPTEKGHSWGPTLRLGSAEQLQERERLDSEFDRIQAELEQLKKEYREPSPSREAELVAWERGLQRDDEWQVLEPLRVRDEGQASFRVLADQSVLVSGADPETNVYFVRVRPRPGRFTAVRVEVLPDPSLPGGGPGRDPAGNFVLTGFAVRRHVDDAAADADDGIPFRSASATFEQIDAPGDVIARFWSARSAFSPDRSQSGLGWSIADRTGTAQEAIFETEADVRCEGEGASLTIMLRHDAGAGRTLGRFRLSVADARRPVEVSGYALPPELRETLRIPPEQRLAAGRDALANYYASHVSDEGSTLHQRLLTTKEVLSELDETIPSVLIVERVEPRPTRVLCRGDWRDESGELVEPGIPGALPQPAPQEGRATRLDLAQWIVSPENPLPARVLANRLWKLGFGTPLSRTADDFGSQGAAPTHPDLLDWLAGGLIDAGWDVKQTLRLIVTSGTYRQASTASREGRERDPENRWWSRQARFRLDAELVRDNALAVSGLLSPRIGGESVKPYQPDGFWDHLKETDRRPRRWIESSGENLYRRGSYTHWQRQYLHPMLAAFDAPSREECAADRPRSNTPMQALVLLNDPTFVEAARVLAERALREGGPSTSERVNRLCRAILSRPAEPDEQAILVELLERHLAKYRKNPRAARELLSVGRTPVPSDCGAAELAAWTNLARVVLNLHDAVMRK